MALQPPSQLARLPQPLGGAEAQCQFAEVYGVDGSRKRKRHEVAAAIDGEGVNIYNVQFPKLVTSYAVPPQASFSCPPLALRTKGLSASLSKRRTYCAIDGPEKRLQCFYQEVESGDRHAGNISSSSFVIQDTSSPTVFMDIVPTAATYQGHDGSFDIIIAHKDGMIRRLSQDLATERWSTMAMQPSSTDALEVQAGFVAGFEEARKGILRKRPDVVATTLGDRASTRSENPSVLILVSHPSQKKSIVPSDVRVHLFSVPAHVPASETQRLRSLMTFDLPSLQGAEMLDSKRVHWNANPGTGELSVSFDSGFISYDLSQYTPQVSSHLLLEGERFSSVMRITPRAVIAASQSSIAVYNTQYRSVQAELPLSDALSSISAKHENNNPAFEFISHSPKLAVAVAACGFHLFALDLESFRHKDVSRRKGKGGLLIDAIGKGVAQPEAEVQQSLVPQNAPHSMQPLGHTQTDVADRWAETKSELDAAVKAQNPVQFDTVVKTRFSNDGKAKLPPQKEFVDPEKISYLLSTMFSLKTNRDGSSSAPRLSLSFWPRETFQWLMNTGRLNSTNVHAALRKAALPRVLPPLPHDALIQTLADHHKGSIRLLLQILRSPVSLNTFELASALRILLDFARVNSNKANSDAVPKTLTEAPHKPEDATQEVASLREADDKPPSQESESAVTNAIVGLNLALTRLHSQPSDQVSTSICSAISNTDALSIINHLRHSLATGGYISRVTDEPQPESLQLQQQPGGSHKKIPPLSLPVIIDLLNATINAIGPSGWISAAGFASSHGSEATLIADMKTEVSAVLAGIEEASYLKGILREFLRCCESASGTQSASTSNSKAVANNNNKAPQQTAGLKRKERHNGAEIEIYDPPTEPGGVVNGDTRALPLSLKLSSSTGQACGGGDGEPSKIKVLKSTGEVKTRSNREVNYLKRKAVGKYSFERIIV